MPETYPLALAAGLFGIGGDTGSSAPRERSESESSNLETSESSGRSNLDTGTQTCRRCAVVSFKMKTANQTSTSYQDPEHEAVASDGTRFFYAPVLETPDLIWELEHGDLVTRARLELFAYDSESAIWSRDLDGSELTTPPESVWDGKLPSEAQRHYPDRFPTVGHSPYAMKLTILAVTSDAQIDEERKEAWTYFDILVDKIDLYWGTEHLIPTDRDDPGMPEERKETIREDEIAVLEGLVGEVSSEEQVLNAQVDGEPTDLRLFNSVGEEDLDVPLPCNLFKAGHLDPYENDFQETSKHWGLGTRIPLLAEILVRHSDGEGKLVPEAVGGSSFVWDWEDREDPAESPKWEAWTGDEGTERDQELLRGVWEAGEGEKDDVPSDNCPARFGGKRGQGGAPVFPEREGYEAGDELKDGAFPFPVSSCSERAWAARSSAWTEGVLKGRTGAIFQPSRMGGDAYKVTVRLEYHDSLDTPEEAAADLRTAAGTAAAATGTFEVLRRVDLTYAHLPGVTALDTNGLKEQYRDELGIHLELDDHTVDMDRWWTALDQEIDRINRDQIQVQSREGLPLYVRFGVLNPTEEDVDVEDGCPAIVIKPHDEFVEALEASFKEQLLRLELDADLGGTAKPQEIVGGTSNARGIVVYRTPAAAVVMRLNDGVFQENETVTALSNGGTAQVTGVTRGCWNIVVYPLPGQSAANERQIVLRAQANAGGTIHELGPEDAEAIHRLSFGAYSNELTEELAAGVRRFLAGAARATFDVDPEATLEVAVIAWRKTKNRTLQWSSRSLTRLTIVSDYLQQLSQGHEPPTGKRVLDHIDRTCGTKLRHGFNPDEWFEGVSDYKAVAQNLFEGLLKRYVALSGWEDSARAVLFHAPGRDSHWKVLVSGAFHTDAGSRTLALTQIATWEGGGHWTQRTWSDDSDILYKAADPIASHELAHALFIPHALEKTGRRPPPPLETGHHTDNCIMNYDQDSERFCGLCVLRIRGWDWPKIKEDLTFAVTKLQLKNEGGDLESTSHVPDPKDKTPDKVDFHFAPLEEVVHILYSIEDDHDLVTGGRLELRRARDGELLWRRDLDVEAGECDPGDHDLRWNGVSGYYQPLPGRPQAVGARSENGEFWLHEYGPYDEDAPLPQEVLSISESPYVLQLVLEGDGFGEPGLAWTNFEVKLAPVVFEWGPLDVLAASPTLGTGNDERDQWVWNSLSDRRNLTNLAGRPPKKTEEEDQTKRVYLWSNSFSATTAQQWNNHPYDAHRAVWGDGPNIPLFARLRILASGGAPNTVPETLSNLKCVWDWEDCSKVIRGTVDEAPGGEDALRDADEEFEKWLAKPRATPPDLEWQQDQQAQLRKRAIDPVFLADKGMSFDAWKALGLATEYEVEETPTSPAGRNCHADRGGKRGTPTDGSGSARAVFPPQAGVTPASPRPGQQFPFAVAPLTDRTWSVSSGIWSEGAADCVGRTGVIFQPSIQGGDRYRLHLYLTHDADDLDESDPDLFAAAAEDLGPERHAATGVFEVWREVHIAGYFKKRMAPLGHYDNPAPGGVPRMETVDLTQIQAGYDNAFIRVVDEAAGPTAVVRAHWNQAFAAALTSGNLPDYLVAAVDQTGDQWADSDDAVNFVDFDTWKQNMIALYGPTGDPDDHFTSDTTFAPTEVNPFGVVPVQDDGSVLNQYPDQNATSLLWRSSYWERKSGYEGACQTNWARMVFLEVVEQYLAAQHPARADGVYVFQVNELDNFGGPNGFGVPLQAATNGFIVLCGNKYTTEGRNSREQTLGHEIGHCLGLNHPHAGAIGDPTRLHELVSKSGCLMSYNFSVHRVFCTGCMLRLRGWSFYRTDNTGATQEPRYRSIWQWPEANRRPAPADIDAGELDKAKAWHDETAPAPIPLADLTY